MSHPHQTLANIGFSPLSKKVKKSFDGSFGMVQSVSHETQDSLSRLAIPRFPSPCPRFLLRRFPFAILTLNPKSHESNRILRLQPPSENDLPRSLGFLLRRIAMPRRFRNRHAGSFHSQRNRPLPPFQFRTDCRFERIQNPFRRRIFRG